MLIYGDVVTLENQFQSHSQASQCILMDAAKLALSLTVGVGYPLNWNQFLSLVVFLWIILKVAYLQYGVLSFPTVQTDSLLQYCSALNMKHTSPVLMETEINFHEFKFSCQWRLLLIWTMFFHISSNIHRLKRNTEHYFTYHKTSRIFPQIFCTSSFNQ